MTSDKTGLLVIVRFRVGLQTNKISSSGLNIKFSFNKLK